MTDSSRPSTSLPTLFDLSHSNRYIVLSHFMVVLTCISLATNDGEHLLICLFASFLLELSVFLLGFVSSLCILVCLLWDTWFGNIFFPSVAYLSFLLKMSFQELKLLTLVKSYLLFFSFMDHVYYIKIFLPKSRSWRLFAYVFFCKLYNFTLHS